MSSSNLSVAVQNQSEFVKLFQTDPVLKVLYGLTLLPAMVVNSLLIYVAFKFNYTKDVTNIFLVNLSLADIFIILICMPIQLSKSTSLVWLYGNPLCAITNYVQGVAVAASIFTIAAMSVDRCLSLSPKLKVKPPGRKLALILIGLLWMVALAMFIPMLMVSEVRQVSVHYFSHEGGNGSTSKFRNVSYCTETWHSEELRKLYGILSFCIVYVIPGFITISSYVIIGRTLSSVRPPIDIYEEDASMLQGVRLMRERKRLAWNLLLLAALFALCWLPYNILQLLLDINVIEKTKNMSLWLPYALYLGHANSALNPIMYFWMAKNFQRSLKKVLCGKAGFQLTKFTWRCYNKPELPSSDCGQYHSAHKRCHLQMTTLRRYGATRCDTAQPPTVRPRIAHLSHRPAPTTAVVIHESRM